MTRADIRSSEHHRRLIKAEAVVDWHAECVMTSTLQYGKRHGKRSTQDVWGLPL